LPQAFNHEERKGIREERKAARTLRKTAEGALAFWRNGLGASSGANLYCFLIFAIEGESESDEGTFPKEYFDGEKSEFGGPAGVRNRVS
jgi:hypothetical protein